MFFVSVHWFPAGLRRDATVNHAVLLVGYGHDSSAAELHLLRLKQRMSLKLETDGTCIASICFNS